MNNPDLTQLTTTLASTQLGNLGVKDKIMVRQPGGKKLVEATIQEILEDPADNTRRTVRLLFDNRTVGEPLQPGQFDIFVPSGMANGAQPLPAAPR